MNTEVSIVMGSDSDYAIMQSARYVLNDFNIKNEVRIISAHRTPDACTEFAKQAEPRGVKVIIAGAGFAAALPGSIAALTTIPVIGVPISSSALNGQDSLYSIVQMPSGIPVATVGIDAAKNAGLLATQILAINDEVLKIELRQYRFEMAEKVILKDREYLAREA